MRALYMPPLRCDLLLRLNNEHPMRFGCGVTECTNVAVQLIAKYPHCLFLHNITLRHQQNPLNIVPVKKNQYGSTAGESVSVSPKRDFALCPRWAAGTAPVTAAKPKVGILPYTVSTVASDSKMVSWKIPTEPLLRTLALKRRHAGKYVACPPTLSLGSFAVQRACEALQ